MENYKMEKVIAFTDELNGSEHIIVEREDGSTISTPKSIYDELKANEAKIK
jgi:hypothetical protein